MGTLWGAKRWGTFRWGNSTEFENLLALKDGVTTTIRMIWKLDAGDQDISNYILNPGSLSREKERAPDRITAGDMMILLDNTSGVFSERSSSSFLNGVNYHNRNITIELGLQLKDGTFEYRKIATMKVRSTTFATDNKSVQLQCYDLVIRLLSEPLNMRPVTLVPTAGAANVGDGTISEIATKPFVTVGENWTITCTLAGGDDTATFSVVGSVSGNIGTATSGTEFSNATTGGIKLKISVGDVDWALDDVFTFSTVQMMEWAATNPIKIIWSILTGTAWDTGNDETWKSRTPLLDSTQSSANTDIDYASFNKAVSDADDMLFTMKGFIPWDFKLAEAIEEIIFHFLGAIDVDASGRIYVKIFRPEFDLSPPTMKDTDQISSFSYTRDVRQMVNRVEIRYRKADVWPWSDADEETTLDGVIVKQNAASNTAYNQWFTLDKPFLSRWQNDSGDHVDYLATRIIDKYGTPPLRILAESGLDQLEREIGDVVALTESKYGFSDYPVEVVQKDMDLGSSPKRITLQMEDTGTVGFTWGFLGSSADEGDGLSPQAASYDNATAANKFFCYASQTGGSGADGPDYYTF